MSDGWRCRYYRLLGAKIGVNVKLSEKVYLDEADLVCVGDDVTIDARAIVSPFCADGGSMMLSAIEIGSGCAVCSRSIVAPGASLHDGAVIGPLSSSHELDAAADSEASRAFCRVGFEGPSLGLKLCIGYPCLAFQSLLAFLPVAATIFGMTYGRDADPTTWGKSLAWFLTPHRIGFYLLVRLERVWLCPFLELLAAIIVKRCVIGKFREGPKSGWAHFQYWLMKSLVDGRLCGCHKLVGNHWGGVSAILRLLGARVGDRVLARLGPRCCRVGLAEHR